MLGMLITLEYLSMIRMMGLSKPIPLQVSTQRHLAVLILRMEFLD